MGEYGRVLPFVWALVINPKEEVIVFCAGVKSGCVPYISRMVEMVMNPWVVFHCLY